MTTKKPASNGGTKPSALPHFDVSEGFLRRAIKRIKRAFRYRSAVDGEFVSKEYAEANPDTTIREKAD